MSHRDVLKNIVKFGKREFAEKKPLNLKVLRIKSKSILTRGLLPSLNIRQIKGTFFIITAEYSDYIRIYSFAKNGQLLGGENIEKNQKIMKEIFKSTTLEYHLPKEKPKLTIDDITRHYQNEFNKILLRMNQLFGFNLKLPYTIIAHKDLKLQMGRMIGCAKSKNKDKLVISIEAYKKDFFESIATREIIYLYLKDLIVLNQEIEDFVVYWYDLAILFTNFYLKNEKNEYLRNIMEKTTISYFNFNDGHKYYLSDKVIEVLKKNTKAYTTKEVNILFSNIFSCLKILKEYKIRLNIREFVNLFFSLCDVFLEENELDFFKPSLKLNYYNFHYKHFQKTLEMDMDSKKSAFLNLMFSFITNKSSEVKPLNDLIQDINNFTEDLILQKEVINYKKLVDDAIVEYILNKIIKVNYSYKIQNEVIEFKINIKNNSEYIFQNFSYNLTWKPRNRISLVQTEEKIKALDLHNELSRIHIFSIETLGNITLFCNINFLNPFESTKKIKKVVNLIKIDLEK